MNNKFEIDLNVGDTAWFFTRSHHGEMTSGIVVGVVERYGRVYVIEVDTHIDPIYYARTALEVSDSKDKPIGMWRWIRSSYKGE
jgi:hypothetical protein